MGPCITNVFSIITKKMQSYTISLFLWNAIYVSGGSSAHHQELKSVYIASGTLSYRYLPLSVPTLPQPMLYIQFWAPGDGRRNRLEHVEHSTEINKLCNVASCWSYLKIRKCTSLPKDLLLPTSSANRVKSRVATCWVTLISWTFFSLY